MPYYLPAASIYPEQFTTETLITIMTNIPQGTLEYDYAQDRSSALQIVQSPSAVFSEGHYEWGGSLNLEPYWEPASAEDKLKNQLNDVSLDKDSLT